MMVYNNNNNNNNIGFYFLSEHDTSKIRLSFMPLSQVAQLLLSCSSFFEVFNSRHSVLLGPGKIYLKCFPGSYFHSVVTQVFVDGEHLPVDRMLQ